MEVRGFQRLIAPLARRVGGMVKRAVIERVKDATGIQAVQVTLLKGETHDDVEHVQPFGLSFRPPDGAEGITLAVQGDPANRVMIGASSRADRPREVEPHEGGLYQRGAWLVFLDSDGITHLGAKQAADAAALASRVLAELQAIRAHLDTLKATYDAHVHVAPFGGTSGPPAPAPAPHEPESVASSRVMVEP